MNSIDNIRKVVEGKTICLITGGKSIEELESRIEEFKDLNVLWAGMNRFELVEDNILKKINKHFDIIGDCSTVGYELRNNYERKVRLPRFEEFLTREENNMLMTSEIVITQSFVELSRGDLPTKYGHKIAVIEEIYSYPESRPPELWSPPPNSLCLAISMLVAGMAKKIICFGFDGFPYSKNMTTDQILESYYKSDKIKEDRIIAFGSVTSGNLVGDTVSVNKKFPSLWSMYKSVYNNPTVEIVNCSPKTFITAIKTINYNQLKGEVI